MILNQGIALHVGPGETWVWSNKSDGSGNAYGVAVAVGVGSVGVGSRQTMYTTNSKRGFPLRPVVPAVGPVPAGTGPAPATGPAEVTGASSSVGPPGQAVSSASDAGSRVTGTTYIAEPLSPSCMASRLRS